MRGGMLAVAMTVVLALSGCAGGHDIRATAPFQETQDQIGETPNQIGETPDQIGETQNQVEETPDPPITWGQTDSPMPADFCKVPDQRPEQYRDFARGHTVDGVSWGGPSGFPLVEQTVPTIGTLDWLIVMVAFQDTPKYVEKPEDFLEPQVKKLEAWAEFWSQGKLEFNISFVDYWIDLPINAMDRPKRDGELANMIVDGMPQGVHPDYYDATFVQWANLAEASGVLEATQMNDIRFTLRMGSNEESYEHLEEQPRLFWAPGVYHSSDQKQPLSLKREFTYGHFLHEILHEMGLNLHAPGNGWSTGVGQALYPNPMGWSASINAWESFQLGWTDDDQVHCVDPAKVSSTKTVLTPIDLYGGERKLIALPTNNDLNEIVVVEARQAGPWTDWRSDQKGLLVYKVDPTAEHKDHVEGDCGNDPDIKKWAYYLYPNDIPNPEPNCNQFDLALVSEGQSVTYSGVTVSLETIYDDEYYVKVEND
jgi:hypothetical protein